MKYCTVFGLGTICALGCNPQPGPFSDRPDGAPSASVRRDAIRYDPQTELAAATADTLPHTLVRRDADAGAAFGPVTVSQLRVGGGMDGAQFVTARADVPTVVVGLSEYKPKGWLVGNHLELSLSAGAPVVLLEPAGYPPGSELKVWATQDATGNCGLKFNGAWVDHAGRGFAPLNTKPAGVDFYHFYLRPSGEWWLEEHQ